MKIQNIKINHYGNLSEKEIDLQNQINIIYGKNESGKSTLLSYIKNMLYGISKNKNGKELSDYEKYKPWFREEFSGRLKYSLDNGREFEIFKDFNKKNPKIYNENLEDISNQFNQDKKDGIQFFYEQTKVDETIFLSTIVSMQQEVKLDRQSQNTLVQKMTNLVGTGEDNISYKKIIDRLSKKQLDEIGTERTQGKPINIVKKDIQECINSLKELNNKKIEREECLKKEKEIQNKIYKIEIREKILGEIEQILLKSEIEEEKINLKNRIKEQNNEKLEQLIMEKQKFLQEKDNINTQVANENKEEIKVEKKSNKKKMCLTVLAIATIMLTILHLICNNILNVDMSYYLTIPTCIILAYILDYYVMKERGKRVNKVEKQLKEERNKYEQERIKKDILIIDNKIEVIQKQISEIENQNSCLENDICIIQKEIDNRIDIKLEQIKSESTYIELEELLDNMNLEYIKNKISEIQEEIREEQIKLNTIEIRRKTIDNELESMITIQEKLNILEEEKEELENQNMYIELTKQYLNNAYEKMRNQVAPKFTENLSRNISEITGQRYKKVSINEEEGLIVENEYGEYIPVSRLSVGTIDQLYLSLRLSMLNEISKESMPIILDEAFAYFDEIRLENILKFLITYSNRNQIIIFTCTKREQDILNKLNVPYNLVELSV